MYLPKQAVPVQRNSSLAVAHTDWSRSGLVPAVMLDELKLNTTTFGNGAEQTVGNELFKDCGPVKLSQCELSPGAKTMLQCVANVACKTRERII